MGFFSVGINEKPGNVMEFFHQGLSIFSPTLFKLIILMSYLLGSSLNDTLKDRTR